MSDLRDGARADHRNAKRLAHRPVLACPSPIPAQRYITPVRSETVDSPLESTPRASSVKRHRLAPISAPSVPFSPAVISFKASCTNVPKSALTDRKSTRLNSSHQIISYPFFCLTKKTNTYHTNK